MTAIARCAAVAIAICSWIAVSNHCVFAAVASEIDKAQTECPFHSKPSKQKGSSQVQCCKVLRAVVFAKTKHWARDDAQFCDANFTVQADESLAYSSRLVAPLLFDTGPPGAFSFAELILQSSLLALAGTDRSVRSSEDEWHSQNFQITCEQTSSARSDNCRACDKRHRAGRGD